ncbi:MAG: hypothetical protein QF752_14270 [Planctomycetota bacterium]|nr:hypothetical protein [Planctomycetota bacterium]
MDQQQTLKKFASTRRAVFVLGLVTLCFGIVLLFLSLTVPKDRSARILCQTFGGGFLLSGFGLLSWKPWARLTLLVLHVLYGLGCLATTFWPGICISLIFVIVLINHRVSILMDHDGSVESATFSQQTEEALDLFD